ncbi:hypothetical protein ISCGN_026253 [Ixodes scapularis]
MLLNVQLEEYLPLTVEAGFLIMIHHPWAEEDITQDVTFVAPGMATFISVLMSVFSRLKAPYKNPCRDDWPLELRAHVDKNNLYTAFECRDYCLQTHVFNECGCVSHRFLRPLIGELSEADVCAIHQKSGRSCNCIQFGPGGQERSGFQRLKAPYKNPCRDDWPLELRAHVDKNNLYTAFECRDYCLQTHVFNECGCVSHRFLRPLIGELSEADVCAVHQKSELCEKEVEKKIKEGRISCNCIAACRDIIYKTSTSSLSLGQSRVSNGNQMSWPQNKLQAKVTIYKQTSKTHYRTRTPNYKVANFLSRIGGTLGMYLGLSSLVLFSLVDAIYRSILARLTRRVRHHGLAQINP